MLEPLCPQARRAAEPMLRASLPDISRRPSIHHKSGAASSRNNHTSASGSVLRIGPSSAVDECGLPRWPWISIERNTRQVKSHGSHHIAATGAPTSTCLASPCLLLSSSPCLSPTRRKHL